LPPPGISSRVEAYRHPIDGSDGKIFSKVGVECPADLPLIKLRSHVQTTGHLANCVDAAIRSAGQRHRNCSAEKLRRGRFQIALNRPFARLTLRAGEPPSIVRDHQLQTVPRLMVSARIDQLKL
jgi:hypothetical protein